MAKVAQLKGVIRLQPGSTVKVHGLEKQAELNGLIGSCLEFDASKMRWGVRLPSGKKVLLKMNNLLPVDATVEPAVSSETDGRPCPARTPRREEEAEVPEGAEVAAAAAAEAPQAAATPPPPPPEAGAAPPPPPAPPGASGVAVPASTGASDEDCKAAGDQVPHQATPIVAESAGQPAMTTTFFAEDGNPEPPTAETPLADPAPDQGQQGEAQPAECPGGAQGLAAAPGQPPAPAAAAAAAAAPRTGRWWQNEAAAELFVGRLQSNDPKLKSLCLVPPLRFEDDDVFQICDALRCNTCCTELVASGHPLSDEACGALANMLRASRTLETLSVGDSSLGDRAAAIFAGLAENTSVRDLDLEHKGLTASAGLRLAEALEARRHRGAAPLASLRLSRNPALAAALPSLAAAAPPPGGGAPKALLLCDAGLGRDHGSSLGLWVSHGVTDLDLRDNPSLGSEGIEAFVRPLLEAQRPAVLRRLCLSGCAVGDDGVEALAGAMGSLPELDELLLERCEVTSEGCEHLSRALRGRRLRMLSLRGNGLGDAGVAEAARCGDRLDVSAAQATARALEALGEQPLLALELFNSPELGRSVGQWCGALEESHWQLLEQLDLSGCGLGNSGFHLICTALLERPWLMPRLGTLLLGSNEVEDNDEMNSLVERLAEARARPGGGLRVVWKNT